jgi:hypothetical protein
MDDLSLLTLFSLDGRHPKRVGLNSTVMGRIKAQLISRDLVDFSVIAVEIV